MMRTPNRDIAKTRAADSGRSYALCVVDGMFYVGTKAELDKIPCVIEGSYEAAHCQCRPDGVEPCRLHGGA